MFSLRRGGCPRIRQRIVCFEHKRHRYLRLLFRELVFISPRHLRTWFAAGRRYFFLLRPEHDRNNHIIGTPEQ